MDSKTKYEVYLKSKVFMIDEIICSKNKVLNGLKRTYADFVSQSVEEIFNRYKETAIENGEKIKSESYTKGDICASLIIKNSDMTKFVIIREAIKNAEGIKVAKEKLKEKSDD